MNKLRTLITPGWRPGRAAVAGLLATAVYSIAMEGDKFLIGNRFSDVRFIEGLLLQYHQNGSRSARKPASIPSSTSIQTHPNTITDFEPGGERRSKSLILLAWLIHFGNGVALAEIYAALAKRFLPGPDWLKGSLFGEVFIIGAWFLTPLADKYHPLIKDGELPKLANWTSFLQNLLRHLAFGLTLGLLYRD